MAWTYFKMSEFTCQCGCQENYIEESFVDRLDELRALVGFALPITSGYRCPVHNARVSSTGADGPHTTGQAADIAVDRQKAYAVLQAAVSMGFTGVGLNQKGGRRFVHLDTLPNAPGQPRPTVWTY